VAAKIIQHRSAIIPGFGTGRIDRDGFAEGVESLLRPLEVLENESVIIKGNVRSGVHMGGSANAGFSFFKPSRLHQQNSIKAERTKVARLLAQNLFEISLGIIVAAMPKSLYGLCKQARVGRLQCRLRIFRRRDYVYAQDTNFASDASAFGSLYRKMPRIDVRGRESDMVKGINARD
jgi:hypothetical protein